MFSYEEKDLIEVQNNETTMIEKRKCNTDIHAYRNDYNENKTHSKTIHYLRHLQISSNLTII